MKTRVPLAAILIVATLVAAGPGGHAAQILSGSTPSVEIPTPDIGVAALTERASAQRATVDQFNVFYQFHLRDALPETGITFVHRVVDDAGRNYKAVHYDHGTGIAVADVDGDGLEDLYFVNQLGGNELWKNLGHAQFTNITPAAGVALPDKVSVTASFADTDNDGDEDLFVTTVRGGNVLFENNGRGRFTNISATAGLAYVGHSSGAVFFDFDRDGLVDLYLCNVGRYTTDQKGRGGAYVGLADAFSGHLHHERGEAAILYRNAGHNHFTNISAEAGLDGAGWSGDASAGDINDDGFPDLYVLNMQGSDHLFENLSGRRFADRTDVYFPKTPWGSMGVKFFDYDNNGRADLLVTDMHSDMSVQVGPDREKRTSIIAWPAEFLGGDQQKFLFGNALYHRGPDGSFTETSDSMGIENYWPWGVSVGDLNADGWQDVFITSSMNFPFRYGINSMLLNNRGAKFLDSEFLLGIEPRRDGRTHTPWFDVDCSAPDSMCPAGVTGKVTIMATLGSRSSAMFDVDHDGDLDIITNDFNSAPQVLISDLAERRQLHWLSVVLAGTRSNRDGLGAKVRVVAGDRMLTQWQDGKSGYLSQSDLPLYFGLGDVARVDRVEIDWPSGRRQVVTKGIQMNATLKVTEPR
jgi:enediyne biosynthesis protein E4